LRSCALCCAFEHFGNTGENIKRMQRTRESPKISVIEINACEVRPTNCCNGIAQVFAFRSRLGGMISVNLVVSQFQFRGRLRLHFWQSKVRLCPIPTADVETNSRRNILSNRLTKWLATASTSYRQRTSQQRRVLASQTMAHKQFPSTWKTAVEAATYVKAAGDSGVTAQIPVSGSGLKGWIDHWLRKIETETLPLILMFRQSSLSSHILQ
jgi:hypothetical protein